MSDGTSKSSRAGSGAPGATHGVRDRRPIGAVALAAALAGGFVVHAGVATGEWVGVAVTLLQIVVVATTTAWGIWSSDAV